MAKTRGRSGLGGTPGRGINVIGMERERGNVVGSQVGEIGRAQVGPLRPW